MLSRLWLACLWRHAVDTALFSSFGGQHWPRHRQACFGCEWQGLGSDMRLGRAFMIPGVAAEKSAAAGGVAEQRQRHQRLRQQRLSQGGLYITIIPMKPCIYLRIAPSYVCSSRQRRMYFWATARSRIFSSVPFSSACLFFPDASAPQLCMRATSTMARECPYGSVKASKLERRWPVITYTMPCMGTQESACRT